MTEKQFAEITVNIWRLRQKVDHWKNEQKETRALAAKNRRKTGYVDHVSIQWLKDFTFMFRTGPMRDLRNECKKLTEIK